MPYMVLIFNHKVTGYLTGNKTENMEKGGRHEKSISNGGHTDDGDQLSDRMRQ